MLSVGGKVREDDAAMILIQEFRSGKLGRLTLEQPQIKDKL